MDANNTKPATHATADVVIIGAGLNGAATAFWLAARGITNVVVLDRSYPGSGATNKGMGLLRTYHANPADASLAIASLAVFRDWAEIVGGSCGYVPAGFLWLDNEAGVDEVRANSTMLTGLGASTRLIGPAELSDLQPQMFVDDVAIAAYEPDAGYAYGALANDALLARAMDLGVQLRTYEPALGIETSGGRVRGVRTKSGLLACETVVVAAGAWTTPLLEPLGVDIPLEARRLTIGRVHAQHSTVGICSFLDGVIDTSFKPDGVNTARVSMRDDRYGAPIEPDQLNDDVHPSARARGTGLIRHRLPGLGQLAAGVTWTGVDGFTPDFKGIYGRPAGPDGLVVCAGSSEKGFKVSPAVGRAIAEVVVDGACREFDLAPFDPNRFAGLDPSAYTESVSALL